MKKSESKNREKLYSEISNGIDNSNYSISVPGINEVEFSYKMKKQNRNDKIQFYLNHHGHNFQKKITLHQNLTDKDSGFAVIKFSLSEDSKVELILMDSDESNGIYLVNQILKAGNYSFTTGIRNSELCLFQYYYKLVADGYSEVRQMKYSD